MALKTNKHFSSNNFSFGNPKWWGVGIIVTLFFLLNATPLSKNLRGFFYTVSEPVQKFLWAKASDNFQFFRVFFEAEEIKKQNLELRKRNQELIAKEVALKKEKEENQFLRTALDLELSEDFNLMMADIMGKDIGRDFIMINKGSDDGVIFGLPVITQEKALIGKVSEVYEYHSKIQLLTAKDHSFDVEVPEREIFGLAKGQGGYDLLLELIPREKEIEAGDKVVSSIMGGNFPEGLLVGRVSSVSSSDVESFQVAEVVPYFDITQHKQLFLITNFP